jgi:hypothetical protein
VTTQTRPSDDAVQSYRKGRFRLDESLRLQSVEQAESFIQECGLVLLVSAKDILLPGLADAVHGKPYFFEDWDEVIDRVWNWKSVLAARGNIASGKLVRDRLCFMAADVLEALYALAAQDGRSRDGSPSPDRISREALKVYEALREAPGSGSIEGGGIGAKALRKAAGLGAKGGTAQFNRALLELQRGCYILQSGSAMEGGNWTSNRYDLLARMFPDLPAAAGRMSPAAARARLVSRYLATAGMASGKQISAALGLPPAAVGEALGNLSAAGEVVLDRQGSVAWKAGL